MVAEVTRWWLVLMATLQAVTETSGSCTFPAFLTTSGRVWEKHVTNQRGGSVEYYRYFARNVHITIPNDGGATKRYRQTCEESLGNATFIVSRRMDRKTGGAVVATRYQCVQFVQRSYYVIQLRSSPFRGTKHRSLCKAERMQFDVWPMIWPSLRREYIPCGFSGGYNLNIFDGKRGSWMCTGMVARPRLESECLVGEGISLNFRDSACIPHGLAMSAEQRLFCLANWSEGDNTFIVLTDNAFAPHTWMLRLPRDQTTAFSAFIFHDVVADNGDVVTMTTDYVRLDFNRHVIGSLCSDEFPDCPKQNLPCYSPFTESCPNHCKTCNVSSPGENCAFNQKFRGEWTEHKIDWFPTPSHQRHSVTITDTNITIAGFSSFRCMEFKGIEPKVIHRTPMVKTFENGCTPRFACIHLHQVSPSVLRYRLSQSTKWPLIPGVNHYHHICKNDNFKYDIMPLIDTYRSEYEKNVVLSTNQDRVTVECEIMSNFTIRAHFADGGGRFCYGYFTQRCNASDSMTLMLHNCPGRRRLQHFKCLASFQESKTSGTENYRVIITESDTDAQETMCWIFNMRTVSDDEYSLYMLAASECNRATHDAIRLYRYKKALINFQIYKQQNVTCDGDNYVTDETSGIFLPGVHTGEGELVSETETPKYAKNDDLTSMANPATETNDRIRYMVSFATGSVFRIRLQLGYTSVFAIIISLAVVLTR